MKSQNIRLYQWVGLVTGVGAGFLGFYLLFDFFAVSFSDSPRDGLYAGMSAWLLLMAIFWICKREIQRIK